MGEILGSAGYEVKTTTHPSEVVAIAESFRPGLVFVELIAPEIDGVKLSEELSRRFPQLKIVFTGDQVEEKILRYLLDRGVSCDSLEPPFKRQNILDMVSIWLSGSDHIDRVTLLRDSRQFRMALDKYVGSDYGKAWKNPSLIFIEFFECISSEVALDNHSHFLRSLGALLAEFTGYDFAYRCGANRFAILLPRTAKTEAFSSSQRLMQELRSLLKNHSLADRYSPAICVVSAPNDAQSTEQVMEVASQLIDQAKYTETGICVAGTIG